MDEGWATTFELLIGTADLGKKRAEELYKQFRVRDWIQTSSAEQDIAIITPGDALTGGGLGNNEYGKASLGYLAVKDLLGDDLFKKCLHEYMSRWNGKHPIPWDFFNTFNDASGKNLNWFWDNWFFSSSYIDLSLKNVKASGNRYNLIIENIGGMAVPVNIVMNYKDGSSDTIHQTPVIWAKDQKRANLAVTAKKEIASISLDGGIFMDANTNDNTWRTK
jgi:hypothetical protein